MCGAKRERVEGEGYRKSHVCGAKDGRASITQSSKRRRREKGKEKGVKGKWGEKRTEKSMNVCPFPAPAGIVRRGPEPGMCVPCKRKCEIRDRVMREWGY